MQNELNSTIEILEQGGTILYPTDTIWGIGCDATNAAAIEKIYEMKQRDHSKSMLILCADEVMLRNYISGPMINSHEDRPTTIIYPNAINLPKNLLAADGSIGIRIPKMEFCQRLLRLFGKPIVSTSANLSGEPSPACFDEISMALKERVSYIVPNRPEYNRNSQGSRIVKVASDGEIVIIRP